MRVPRIYSNGREQHGPRLRELPRVTDKRMMTLVTSISTDGTTTFVGAFDEDTKGSAAGAAYIFSKGAKAVPSLTFDNYNKLTVSNFNSTSNEWPPPRPWTTPAQRRTRIQLVLPVRIVVKMRRGLYRVRHTGTVCIRQRVMTVILNSATNHGPWKLV